MSAVLMDIIMLILLLVSVVLALIFTATGKKDTTPENENCYEPGVLAQKVKEIINEIINQDITALNLTEKESKKREEQRKVLKKAMRCCAYGGYGEKEYLKDYIRDVLQRRLGINEETIDLCLPFDRPAQLSARDMFDIMMLRKSKQEYKTAFLRLAEEHAWFQPKEDEEGHHYIVTK